MKQTYNEIDYHRVECYENLNEKWYTISDLRINWMLIKLDIDIDKIKKACEGCYQNVEDQEDNKNDEILVVSIPNTVVDIHAMMIKFLNTLSAYHTMESLDGFNDFTIETVVLQVYILFISDLQHVNHI